jgi:hypothetical protein
MAIPIAEKTGAKTDLEHALHLSSEASNQTAKENGTKDGSLVQLP